MANFTPSKKTAEDYNNGVEYIDGIDENTGDAVQAETINNLIKSQLWVQSLATTPPDVTNAGQVGIPTVEVVDQNTPNPHFKFSHIKGNQGDSIRGMNFLGSNISGNKTINNYSVILDNDTDFPLSIETHNGENGLSIYRCSSSLNPTDISRVAMSTITNKPSDRDFMENDLVISANSNLYYVSSINLGNATLALSYLQSMKGEIGLSTLNKKNIDSALSISITFSDNWEDSFNREPQVGETFIGILRDTIKSNSYLGVGTIISKDTATKIVSWKYNNPIITNGSDGLNGLSIYSSSSTLDTTATEITLSTINNPTIRSLQAEDLVITSNSNLFRITSIWRETADIEFLQSIKGADGRDGINGADGTPATLQSSSITYQNSTSGTTVPTGTWSETPSPTKGQYLWTRTTLTFNTGKPVVSYAVAYIGTNAAISIMQSTGTSTTSVMSQKATTDAINSAITNAITTALNTAV